RASEPVSITIPTPRHASITHFEAFNNVPCESETPSPSGFAKRHPVIDTLDVIASNPFSITQSVRRTLQQLKLSALEMCKPCSETVDAKKRRRPRIRTAPGAAFGRKSMRGTLQSSWPE